MFQGNKVDISMVCEPWFATCPVAVAGAADGHPQLWVLVPRAAGSRGQCFSMGGYLLPIVPLSFIIQNVFARFLLKSQRLVSTCQLFNVGG